MISTDSVRTIFGIIGNAFCTPFLIHCKVNSTMGNRLSVVLLEITTIINNEAVEPYSPLPHLAHLLNCMMWFIYGLLAPNSLFVLTIYGAGFLIEACYIAIFFGFSPRRLRLRIVIILAAELVFVGVILAGVLGGVHTREKRTEIVGIVCAIFGTAMYALPLSIMKTVIETKSVKDMPFYHSFISFLNGLCWICYSLLRFDLYILIPNCVTAMLSIAQIILYFMYYRATPEEEPNQELELQEDIPTSTDT